jgi:hypothetical protein
MPSGCRDDRIRLTQSLRLILLQENPIFFGDGIIDLNDSMSCEQFLYLFPLSSAEARFGQKFFPGPPGVIEIEAARIE